MEVKEDIKLKSLQIGLRIIEPYCRNIKYLLRIIKEAEEVTMRKAKEVDEHKMEAGNYSSKVLEAK